MKKDTYPVKNVTWVWILMEIPCHFISQIDDSLVEIYTKFHDYSMSFIQVLFVFHAQTCHGFWTSSSHGISMVFAKKMTGFPSDLVSFSNQTKLPSIWNEETHITFFTGHAYCVISNKLVGREETHSLCCFHWNLKEKGRK